MLLWNSTLKYFLLIIYNNLILLTNNSLSSLKDCSCPKIYSFPATVLCDNFCMGTIVLKLIDALLKT